MTRRSQVCHAVAALLVLIAAEGCRKPRRAVEPPGQGAENEPARAHGFKWVSGYYSGTNGVQHPKELVTGTEAVLLSNNIVLLAFPRIESFAEDGRLQWIATSVDAWINMSEHVVAGTNIASFRTADTNLFVVGRGFQWQQGRGSPTNSAQPSRGFQWQQGDDLLTLSNDVFTWINQAALTNSPGK